MNSRLLVTLILTLTTLVSAAQCADSFEGIVVFHQPTPNRIESHFERTILPEIQAMAAENGREVRVVDATLGAPPEIHATPAIVFQNSKGRSLFQGRYTDIGKVRHFVQTSTFIPQGDGTIERANAGVRTVGRHRTALQLKVTPLEGPAADDARDDELRELLNGSLYAATATYSPAETVQLERGDRTFYWDVYPYLDEDETLYFSHAIYSQFDCHDFVHGEDGSDFAAPWEQREELIKKLATHLETVTAEIMSGSSEGDGLTPLDYAVKVASWEALGLTLPEPSASSTEISRANLQVENRRWKLDSSLTGTEVPAIQFSFPAPLDSYTGIGNSLSNAELILSDDFSLTGASGHASVEITTLTMGEDGLDASIHSMMEGAAYPESSFNLTAAAPDQGSGLKLGETQRMSADGVFSLKGVEIQLWGVLAELTPYLTPEGDERIDASASFSFTLMDNFNIDGPPGPSPANDTVMVRVHFTLQPMENQDVEHQARTTDLR